MICLVRLYSEYLVTTNNTHPFPFKAPNTSLHLSTENRTVFEFPLSCIMHCCQFHFIYFFLSKRRWLRSQLLFKAVTSLWFIVIFKNICIFFCVQRLCTCFMSNSVKPQMIKTCLVFGFKALKKTCQIVRSKFPQSDI